MIKDFKNEFGALGNWEKFEETFDETIVKQTNDASCVSAVGEMLANHFDLNLKQETILQNIGEWSNSVALARFLNSKEIKTDVEWIGGGYAQIFEHIIILTREIKVWAALLRDGNSRGHAVLVYGESESGFIKIKDPFDQTKYKMKVAELDKVLSEIVFRRNK